MVADLIAIVVSLSRPALDRVRRSTVGMVLADALAIGVGALLGKHLPERAIEYGAAAAFVIFGLLLIASGAGWV